MDMAEGVATALSLGFYQLAKSGGKKNSDRPCTDSDGTLETISPEDEYLLKNSGDVHVVHLVASQLLEMSVKGFGASRGVAKMYNGETHIKMLDGIAQKTINCPALQEICKKGASPIETLQSTLRSEKPNKVEEIGKNITSFDGEVQNMQRRIQSRSNILLQRTPHVSSKLPTTGSLSSIAPAQAQYDVETAERKVLQQMRNWEKNSDEKGRKDRERMEAFEEMQSQKVSEMSYTEAIKLLQKGFELLGDLKNQWSNLANFFSGISSIINAVMKKNCGDFTDYATKAGTELDCSYRLDMIYTSSMKASQAANYIHGMALTYTKVSSKYIMPSLVKLDRIMAFNNNTPSEVVDNKRKELMDACRKNSEEIVALVKTEKREMKHRAEACENEIRAQFGIFLVEDDADQKGVEKPDVKKLA